MAGESVFMLSQRRIDETQYEKRTNITETQLMILYGKSEEKLS